MPTAYSRVTVVNGGRRVDLALPSGLPLADVLPQLLGYCAPEGVPARPVDWTLARLGGGALSLAGTLDEAGISDGDVLELRSGQETAHPAHVEDVRDVLEDTMDGTAQPWQPRTTIGFAIAAGSAGLALAALLPQARAPRAVEALVTAALVAVLLVAAGWWAARRDQPRVALLAVVAAALWGGVGGWLVATFPDWPLAASVSGALTGGALVAGLARALTPVATIPLTMLGLVAAAGVGVGATELAGADPLAGVRVAAVGAVLLVGALPRVSLTVGGLASADYRVRQHGLLTGEELARRIVQSNALLYGGLLGAAVIGGAGGVLLALSGSVWDRLLGGGIGLALVLRSRVFSRVPQILPLRLAGLVALVAQAVPLVQQSLAVRPWAPVLAAALAAGLVAVSAVPLSEVARARVKQQLNRAELVVVVAMIALAATALGVFDWVAELAPS